jgi:hypothetical protein
MRYGRASKIKDGTIEVPLWLIFDVRGNVRLTRGEPDLARSERAMQMTVTVPLALFKTPTISASLTIDAPEMAVPQIDLTAAAEALKSVVGCDVHVRLNAEVEELAE